MSTMMSPRGPLPPRVYWMRRALVAVVLIVVIALVVWAIKGLAGDSPDDATTSKQSPNPPPASTTPSPSDSSPTSPDRDHHQGGKHPHHGKHHSTSTPTTTALPDATCDPTQVDIKIDVDDATLGKPLPSTFELTPLDGSDCTVSITPDDLEVQVTTGDTVVWNSNDCPDALPARRIGVSDDPPGRYRFRWDGKAADSSCKLTTKGLETGGYYLRAAFIGGEPHAGYFDMKS